MQIYSLRHERQSFRTLRSQKHCCTSIILPVVKTSGPAKCRSNTSIPILQLWVRRVFEKQFAYLTATTAGRDMSTSHSTPRPILWVIAALGLATVIIFLYLASFDPQASCGVDTKSPVLAFQDARTVEDLVRIFGSPAATCNMALRTDLAYLTLADLVFFIPVYASFLAGLIYVSRSAIRFDRLFLFAFLTITIAGDILETVAQFKIVNVYEDSEAMLDLLAIGNNAKVLGLAAVLIGLAIMINAKAKSLRRIAAGLVGMCGIIRLSGIIIPGLSVLVPVSSLAAFVLLAIYCFIQAFVRSRRSHELA